MSSERASDKVHKTTLKAILELLIAGKSDKEVADEINRVVGIQKDLLMRICEEQRASIAELMPANPEDPTKPANPEDPTKPANPEDPTKPANPEDPTKPETPDAPAK